VIEVFQGNQSTQVSQNVYIKAAQIVLEASMGITLKVGSNFITIDRSGVAVSGKPAILLNSGGAALPGNAGTLVSPLSPRDPDEADNADPGANQTASGSLTANARMSGDTVGPDSPTHDPNSPANKDKKHWIEIELLDEEDQPVPGEPYRITLPDGSTLASGTLDDRGRARVDHIVAGTCQVTFPSLDQDAWEPK